MTDDVTRLVHARGTSMPWEGVHMSLRRAPSRSRAGVIRLGDWLVIRKNEGLRALVVVTGAGHSQTSGELGRLDAGAWQVDASGWFDHFAHMEVAIAHGRMGPAIGTFFPLGAWQRFLRNAVDAATYRFPGRSLAQAVGILGRLRLPPSLGDGFIGDEIRVVYDDATRQLFAPDVTADPIRGPTLAGLRSGVPGPTSALNFILGTYGADPRLVELFPRLVPVDTGERESAEPEVSEFVSDTGEVIVMVPATPADWLREAHLDVQAHIRELQEAGGELPVEFQEYDEAGDGAGWLGDPRAMWDRFHDVISFLPPWEVLEAKAKEQSPGILGRRLVLAYRLRPWRTQGLRSWMNDELPRARRLLTKDYDDTTWPTRGAVVYPDASVQYFTASLALEDEFTAVTVGLPTHPDAPTRFWEKLGLPIIHAGAVERLGCKILSVNWPFFVPGDESTREESGGFALGTRLEGLYGIAALASHFWLGAGRFLRGQISLREPSVEVSPGETVSIRGVGTFGWLVGYAERVTETWTAEAGGRFRREQTIDYSRGVVTEDGVDYRRARVVPFGPGVGGIR